MHIFQLHFTKTKNSFISFNPTSPSCTKCMYDNAFSRSALQCRCNLVAERKVKEKKTGAVDSIIMSNMLRNSRSTAFAAIAATTTDNGNDKINVIPVFICNVKQNHGISDSLCKSFM